MRKVLFTVLALAVACSIPALRSQADFVMKGDYVEARTASVFAGACHFNGEVVTTGREAVLAWNVTSGNWKGTDLAGVRAMAAVSSDQSLYETKAARRSELVIDNSISDAQATAFAEAVQAEYGATLGKVVAVRRAPVTFRHEGTRYLAEAAGFATLSVEAMPNQECCKMPHLVWYSPLVQLTNRKVGFTAKASYAGGQIGDAWQRSGENSAFYGTFSR